MDDRYLSLQSGQAANPQNLSSTWLFIRVQGVKTLFAQINCFCVLLGMSSAPSERVVQFKYCSQDSYNEGRSYDNSFGSRLVGTVVTIWPHRRVPKPKNKHHNHCSKVSPFVENAIFPYWIMTT